MKNILLKRFQYYKELAEKILHQIPEEKINWNATEEANNMANLIKDLSQKIESKARIFLTEERKNQKTKRNTGSRTELISKIELLKIWEKGWTILFEDLNQIKENHCDYNFLEEALEQLSLYSFYIGQIVFMGKMILNEDGNIVKMTENLSEINPREKLKSEESSDIQQNASPICYAKSDEVRDEFRT